MNKNRIEPERSGDSLPAKRCGQRRYGTTSWHNTAKSSGLPVEVNAAVVQGSIVPLPGEIWRERSGQKSAEAIVVGEMSRSAKLHSKVAGGLTQRRAELHGNVLTAWRTANPPMTPDGEVEPRIAAMGSLWAFRSRLRSVPYAGLSRVRAEPPCTDPYARWSGTRGWLSESVTGTRLCFLLPEEGPRCNAILHHLVCISSRFPTAPVLFIGT